mmetsp:Transcript_20479/g.37592  ORF Transcript_20479/g.37592 Transcript_20479/m.37592 type:complete len:234 (-) Transcript_20479:43-744(-)
MAAFFISLYFSGMVGGTVGKAVGLSVGDSVGLGLGFVVGMEVGEDVVGNGVGDLVGVRVVGPGVGSGVSTRVGDSVKTFDGGTVGASVTITGFAVGRNVVGTYVGDAVGKSSSPVGTEDGTTVGVGGGVEPVMISLGVSMANPGFSGFFSPPEEPPMLAESTMATRITSAMREIGFHSSFRYFLICSFLEFLSVLEVVALRLAPNEFMGANDESSICPSISTLRWDDTDELSF